MEVFSYAVMSSDVCIGVAAVDVAFLSASKASEVCLPLVPTSALDPDALPDEKITASGRIYLSLQLVRHNAASLYVLPDGSKRGKSKTWEEGVALLHPLLAAEEVAQWRRRRIMSPTDGEPVLKDGKPVWSRIRELSLDSRDESARIKYFSTKDLAALEAAANQLTPLEEERRAELLRRERDDDARARRDRDYLLRLRCVCVGATVCVSACTYS